MSNSFILMRKDERLGVVYFNDRFNKFKFELNENAEPFLNFYGPNKNRDYEVLSNVIESFISQRIFPPNRSDARQLLDGYGLVNYDKLALLKKTNGVQVSSPFWFDWGFGLKWDDVQMCTPKPKPKEVFIVEGFPELDDIRAKIHEELREFKNDDFLEVCELVDEYKLEFLLIYVWQNGSRYINRLSDGELLKQFNNLVKKIETKKLYRGFHLAFDEEVEYEDLVKKINEIYANSKFLSFTPSYKIAEEFANRNYNKSKFGYSVVISCEADYAIDVDSVRDFGEQEFIIRPSDCKEFEIAFAVRNDLRSMDKVEF